jgi:hypothetical protein
LQTFFPWTERCIKCLVVHASTIVMISKFYTDSTSICHSGKNPFHESGAVQGSLTFAGASPTPDALRRCFVEIGWEGLAAALCMQHPLNDQPSTSVFCWEHRGV